MNIKNAFIGLMLLVCGSVMAQDRAEVEFQTTEGNIRIALFNETPQHRDNFMKLVRMEFYDSLLFHRVIKDFMIQGGDLHSKHAEPGKLLAKELVTSSVVIHSQPDPEPTSGRLDIVGLQELPRLKGKGLYLSRRGQDGIKDKAP